MKRDTNARCWGILKLKKALRHFPALNLRQALAVFIMCMVNVPETMFASPCNDFARTMCRIRLEPSRSFIQKTQEPVTRVSIADPEIADVQLITPTQVLIISKKNLGVTNLIIWHGDEQAEVYEVMVYMPEKLMQFVRDRIHAMVPGAAVVVWPAKDGGILLDGEVTSQEMLDRTLQIVGGFVDNSTNLITVRGSQQVQLEVRIAEVSRSGMKEMGLGYLKSNDWGIGVFPSGSVEGNLSPGTRSVVLGEQSGELQQVLTSTMALTSPFGSAFQVALHSVKNDTLSILSILKGQGLARMLACPTLVTMSGQEANFLVGGEFPIPVSNEDGNTNIEFKKYGIMLRFTPTVVGKETITLLVCPEVSAPDYSLSVFSGGVAVPGLKTRRGSTTLQLKDGQTFVMAGLLKEETAVMINKIPFLGDIPILGTLFTSKEFQKKESELMIVVTPRLVGALNPDEVPVLPGEEMHDNISDSDFFLMNKTKSNADIPQDAPPAFVGDIGFSR